MTVSTHFGRLSALAVFAVSALTASACSSGDGSGSPTSESTSAATAASSSASPATATVAASPTVPPTPAGPGAVWLDWPGTDFTKTTIDLADVIRGCPERDCIPALDADGAVSIELDATGIANFGPVSAANYPGNYPVAVLRLEGAVRGYPLHILTWHEIVNDRVNGVPVAITFCPLCNTALAFDRTVNGTVLDFGVSGNLRNSDLIMWDRQTESWWQQATGEAIVGELSGTVLKPLSLSVVSFEDFKADFPNAEILTTDTDMFREYGVNPYEGYDALGSTPFLFNGEIDPRMDGLERVVGLGTGGTEFLAVPFSALKEARVANVELAEVPIAVFWTPGTASALDAVDIASARDVGAASAYDARVDGQRLTFTAAGDGRFQDAETGSTWDLFGVAREGSLAGKQLTPVVQTTAFWFAWAAFHAETEIWTAN